VTAGEPPGRGRLASVVRGLLAIGSAGVLVDEGPGGGGGAGTLGAPGMALMGVGGVVKPGRLDGDPGAPPVVTSLGDSVDDVDAERGLPGGRGGTAKLVGRCEGEGAGLTRPGIGTGRFGRADKTYGVAELFSGEGIGLGGGGMSLCGELLARGLPGN